MNRPLFIVLVLLLASLSYSRWDYQNALGQVCFNVSNANGGVGFESDPFYNVITTNITKNSTFWGPSNIYEGNYPVEQRSLDVFVMADSGTDIFFALPEVRNQSAGVKDFYCIYEGDVNKTSIQRIAPYGIGFDTRSEFESLDRISTSGFTASWDTSNGLVNITAPSGFALQNNSAPSTSINNVLYAKFASISVNASSNTSIIGVWDGYIATLINTSPQGSGLGFQGGNIAGGFYLSYHSVLNPTPSGLNIYRYAPTQANPSSLVNDSARVVNATFSQLALVNFNDTGANFGSIKYQSIAYVRNASAQFDWAFNQRGYTGIPQDWASSNVTYDFIDPNIVFLSPQWQGIFGSNDPVLLSVQYQQGYDNCSLTVNGNSVANYTGLAPFQITNDNVKNAFIIVGDNEIKASCRLGGVESHRFWYFTRAAASAENLFESAFNFNITSSCPAGTQVNLAVCTEAYNLNVYYNFSAVICPGLNVTGDFSCLSGAGIANTTKNGFVIFYTPSSSSYANGSDLEHIGAVFNYQGQPLNPGLELVNQTTFVYIPAQTKDRDCDIFHLSNTTGCSWGNGFILNNGSILVSDKQNNWFITGGTGLPIFNINYSQTVINAQVQYISNNTASGPFDVGMYERVNCGVQNGSYVVNIRNTLSQTFRVVVLDNVSFSNFTTSTPLLFQSIPLAGVSFISISSGGQVLCQFGGQTTLFIPDFGLTQLLTIAAFPILIDVLILFMGILGTILPFSLFALVIFNDAYHVLGITDMALVIVLAALGGVINNVTSLDRGIKHLILVFAIATVYLIALGRYDVNGSFTNDITGATDLFNSFRTLASGNQDPVSFVLNTGLFIGALFKLVLFLPASFVNLLFHALMLISPVLATAASPIIGPNSILMLGLMLYFYIKAYEVLANRFRSV